MEKISFPGSARAILAAPTPDEDAKATLEGWGLAPTVLNAIHLGMSAKAARGDPSAAKYLREVAVEETQEEENPAQPDFSALDDRALRRLIRHVGA